MHHAAGGYLKIMNAEGIAAMMGDFLGAFLTYSSRSISSSRRTTSLWSVTRQAERIRDRSATCNPLIAQPLGLPVKAGQDRKAVLQLHVEFFALVQGEADLPGRLCHPVASGGLAVGLDLPRPKRNVFREPVALLICGAAARTAVLVATFRRDRRDNSIMEVLSIGMAWATLNAR